MTTKALPARGAPSSNSNEMLKTSFVADIGSPPQDQISNTAALLTGAKGITVGIRQLPQFVEAIDKAYFKARDLGLLVVAS